MKEWTNNYSEVITPEVGHYLRGAPRRESPIALGPQKSSRNVLPKNFVHLLNKYLLSTYPVTGPELGDDRTLWWPREPGPALIEFPGQLLSNSSALGIFSPSI